MKTLHRFLQVVCLSVVLVLAQSTAHAVIYEEIMNFTYPNSLPVSLSGGVEVESFGPSGGELWWPARIDSGGMLVNPGINNALWCSFSLIPAGPPGWHLIGFGMAPAPGYLGFDYGVLGRSFSPHLEQTAGTPWTMSDVPPSLLSGPTDTVFADPGSYITSFESSSSSIFYYDINAIELFWDVPEPPVPDGGNVLLPFLLTLVLLLGSHQLSRVQTLRGHVGQ